VILHEKASFAEKGQGISASFVMAAPILVNAS
jgi:hypothetical protein